MALMRCSASSLDSQLSHGADIRLNPSMQALRGKLVKLLRETGFVAANACVSGRYISRPEFYGRA